MSSDEAKEVDDEGETSASRDSDSNTEDDDPYSYFASEEYLQEWAEGRMGRSGSTHSSRNLCWVAALLLSSYLYSPFIV